MIPHIIGLYSNFDSGTILARCPHLFLTRTSMVVEASITEG